MAGRIAARRAHLLKVSGLDLARPLVIVNPRSGRGLTESRWARVRGALTDGLGELDSAFTAGPRDACAVARREAEAGRRLIVALGGDGTISEVANGILDAGAGATTELGIIPRGTGGDFRRTLDLPHDVAEAARRIREGQARPLDAGRVHFRGHAGEEEVRHFVNVASFGFSSTVATRANASSKRFGGRMAFFGATLRALVGSLIGVETAETALDLVTVGDFSKGEVLVNLGRLYEGTHLELDAVENARVTRVAVEPVESDARIPIELDGETPGHLPAVFEIVPSALRIRI